MAQLVLKILKVSLLLAVLCSENVIVKGGKVCYHPFGCFDNTKPPWDDFVFSQLPQSPSEIKTSFKLYNAAKPNGVSLDPTSNALSREDKVVILIHGISQGGHENSMYTSMRPELLERTNPNLNVITVDWSGGASDNLFQSIGNSRLVSKQLAYLIKQLKNRRKLRCKNIHIIGFSLGASMAGLVGKELKKRQGCTRLIPRITGLDPVKGGFEAIFGQLDNKAKLERSDAKLVDVIHTSTTFKDRIGNVDFYPNGGSKQPGCPERDTDVIGLTAACNHFRAVELFSSTIRPNGICCVAVKCSKYKRFKNGKCSCNKEKRNMGFETNTDRRGPKGTFYLTTAEADPYCGNCPTPGTH